MCFYLSMCKLLYQGQGANTVFNCFKMMLGMTHVKTFFFLLLVQCVLSYWNQMLALNVVSLLSFILNSSNAIQHLSPSLSLSLFIKRPTYFNGECSPKKRETKATLHHFGLFSTNSAVFSCLCDFLLDKRDCYCISL